MKLRRKKRIAAPRAANDDAVWGAESYPAAALVCAIGFFLHILLSEPLLNILGINYGSENAGLLGKIHPGSYFVVASFFILLASRRNPLEQTIRIAREHTAFFSFFLIYTVIVIYWILRDPKGVGMILDTHIVMPICAIVFSYAPRGWYRPIVRLFAALAVLNSMIGIFESLTQTRIFPFNPDWEVLSQDYFRASALMGHPLTNAVFTAVALFVMLDMRMPFLLKSGIFLIMLASLVAFGGRAALGMSLVGLVILGLVEARKYFASGPFTIMRLLTILLALLLVPAVCGGLLYGALHSTMGERLMAYNSLQDDSASVRVASFDAFDYMTPGDFVFGVSGDRLAAITDRIDIDTPTSDIENPWILMFMSLGGIMFTLWLGGGIACVARLMEGASPALKIAVIDYFAISTTSNSFGRRDTVFMILAGIVVCAKRLKELEKI